MEFKFFEGFASRLALEPPPSSRIMAASNVHYVVENGERLPRLAFSFSLS